MKIIDLIGMNKFKKLRSLLIGGLLSLSITLPATAASTLQNTNTTTLEKSDNIAFKPHRTGKNDNRKRTGEKHENVQKGRKEVKRQADNFKQRDGKKPKGNAERRNSRVTSK